jgi:hypothetical protein
MNRGSAAHIYPSSSDWSGATGLAQRARQGNRGGDRQKPIHPRTLVFTTHETILRRSQGFPQGASFPAICLTLTINAAHGTESCQPQPNGRRFQKPEHPAKEIEPFWNEDPNIV